MKRRRLIAFIALLGWLILLVQPPSVSFSHANDPDVKLIDKTSLRKIEPQILKELESAKDGKVNFIVQFSEKPDLSTASQRQDKLERRRETVKTLKDVAQRSQKASLDYLEEGKRNGKVDSYNSLWVINGASVRADRETVLALAARSDVAAIRADRKRTLAVEADPLQDQIVEAPIPSQITPSGVEWNIAKIRADLVWSALGIDGTGAVVASLDTGVDWQHPALINQYRGNSGKGIVNHNGNWYDFVPPYTYKDYPYDGVGHGTHVTGIMVGSDGTNRIGVAPGAKWIAAKVFTTDSSPTAEDSWIHAAFQWILAPGDPELGQGDPDLAPDIVNCSWGSTDGTDQAFKPDIDALLAAGITPVFAAGNSGSASGSIQSPGSLDDAFSVGATDSSDVIAYFSSRGPSAWGKVKPEISAPGVYVRSSVPGGVYDFKSGTSMATPHIAGVLALLKQAAPTLTPSLAMGAITSTAVALGTGHPNNDYGWGRVDAYAAVAQAISSGALTGVVTDSGGAPIFQATITATNQTTGAESAAFSGQDGSYSLVLAPGFYDVMAGAFGYYDSASFRVAIDAQGIVYRDFSLSALPSGFITGIVTEERTGRPLTATVSVLGTPLSRQTDPTTGAFTLTVPTGVYDVRAVSEKHRVRTQSGVSVTVGSAQVITFVLPTAPSILVVDSGAWYAESQIGYYRSALDQLNYVYSARPITDTRYVPTVAELLPFDIVIWSSPLDSPGYIGADAALAAYMDGGGKLLLSGQDIGYYDSGQVIGISAPYFGDHLHATFVSDDAGVRDLSGIADGIFTGITLTLNTLDSAQNQYYPDAILPDGVHSASVIQYANGSIGGIEDDVCVPYRVLYFGFGLEGAGPAANRVDLIDKAITWLNSQRVRDEVRLLPTAQNQIRESGKSVTSTLTVWNTGTAADSYSANISGGSWPVSLWDGSFSRSITGTGSISACQSITVGVKMDVPPTAGRNVTNTADVSVASLSVPGIRVTSTVSVKTPALILVVDADRWYEVESYYEGALSDDGYAFDVWDTQGGAGPGLSTLNMYSITVWFTGYDWYRPLAAQDEANLTSYLDRGGRLFLSSQDYLYNRGMTDFGLNYLGVLSFTNDITAVQVSGVVGNTVGDGLGPYTLTMPYPGFHDWSDALTPKAPASAAFLNIEGTPAGLTNVDGSAHARSVFFAFPFEGLDADPARLVMDRIIGRALGTDARADQVLARYREPLRYDISIINPGDVAASWSITSVLPLSTTIVSGSLSEGMTFDAGVNRVLWHGVIAPNEGKRLSYSVALQPDATGPLTATTTFERTGKDLFTRTVTTLVGSHVLYFPRVVSGYNDAW